jgi:phosphoglycerol transferase MdoB-like AlkP superfamily enzyme
MQDFTAESKNQIFSTFLMGFRFDLRLSMLLIIPSILLINLPLNPKFKSRLVLVFNFALISVVNLLYILDAGYYSYLKSRMNATIISFLKNPIISFEMVSQSYPWFKLFILICLSSVLFIFIFKKLILIKLEEVKENTKLKIKLSRVLLFILTFALSLYGSFKMYPLRWSEAFQTTDAFSSNLSLNPILYVFDTYSFRVTDFDQKSVEENYSEVANFLKIKKIDAKNLNFLREYPGDSQKMANHPNVIVVIMESLAYFKTGIGGSKVNPTPNIDLLAKDSLLFDQFYTPTVATARSVFAAITSLPDISKVQTGTRNPFIVDQNTIMGQAKNYDKYYFLGGSANWGNIRGVLSYNIPGLNIYEEGSYKSPRVDVWGISDLNLFKEAVEFIDTKSSINKPFFTVIQTSGFHRPYTIPADSDGFKTLTTADISADLVAKYGFRDFAEYNAMRLQDHALGKFFEMIKTKKWYENSIIVVFGDHGLPHENALNVPEWTKFNSNGYHVPFIIHSPKYITNGINNKIASEMDVMPTLAGLIGIPYKTRSLGRDLFNPEFDDYRAAFSYNWYAPFHLTLVDKEFYFEYIPYNGNSQLIKHDELDNTINVKDKYPEVYKKMEKLTKGLYESSKYLLYHNSKTY